MLCRGLPAVSYTHLYRCINRLDRNTSGAVVVAKNAHAATVLGGVGRGGIQVHKRYTALLTGILPYERGIIDAGIARIDEETINRMVDNCLLYTSRCV